MLFQAPLVVRVATGWEPLLSCEVGRVVVVIVSVFLCVFLSPSPPPPLPPPPPPPPPPPLPPPPPPPPPPPSFPQKNSPFDNHSTRRKEKKDLFARLFNVVFDGSTKVVFFSNPVYVEICQQQLFLILVYFRSVIGMPSE